MKDIEIFNDHFQNYKRYGIPKAQLIIADIPYNVGKNAYGSSPQWYVDGDRTKGESEFANSTFFDTDIDFRIPEFLAFCSRMMRPEPKERGKAPAMLVFCAFDQQWTLIEEAKKHGLNQYINLVFRKNFSAQVLKANMRIVGNCEYAILLYRDKLPKFNNHGNMMLSGLDWPRDLGAERVHPTQKPISLLELFIELFTDPGEVVIDPVCGSGSTILAARNLNRRAYGFEIKKNFFTEAKRLLEKPTQPSIFSPAVEKKQYRNTVLFQDENEVVEK
jgi:site-specific DNA-methyltransferase (adenine-specific)